MASASERRHPLTLAIEYPSTPPMPRALSCSCASRRRAGFPLSPRTAKCATPAARQRLAKCVATKAQALLCANAPVKRYDDAYFVRRGSCARTVDEDQEPRSGSRQDLSESHELSGERGEQTAGALLESRPDHAMIEEPDSRPAGCRQPNRAEARKPQVCQSEALFAHVWFRQTARRAARGRSERTGGRRPSVRL